MDTVDDTRIVGLFRTSRQAEAAWQHLRRLGLTEEDVEIGAAEPGRYRLEDRGSNEIGRGVVRGIAFGIPVGAIITVGVLMLAVPGYANMGIGGIGLGVLIGGFWGIYFGGLGGMVPKLIARVDEQIRHELADDGPETLLAARGAIQPALIRDVMRRHGGRFFLEETPALLPRHGAIAAAI